jgi:hypothetical protein
MLPASVIPRCVLVVCQQLLYLPAEADEGTQVVPSNRLRLQLHGAAWLEPRLDIPSSVCRWMLGPCCVVACDLSDDADGDADDDELDPV